jgi:hypothetical protein
MELFLNHVKEAPNKDITANKIALLNKHYQVQMHRKNNMDEKTNTSRILVTIKT